MKKFNVIVYNINSKEFEPYNIIPYLVSRYQKEANKPKTFDEFRDFVKAKSQYQWWSRCEYEIILTDWPCQKIEEKWDIYDQVMMNLDVITALVIKECLKKKDV